MGERSSVSLRARVDMLRFVVQDPLRVARLIAVGRVAGMLDRLVVVAKCLGCLLIECELGKFVRQDGGVLYTLRGAQQS